jgi:tetratricopeptide (TPR) repeat protein
VNPLLLALALQGAVQQTPPATEDTAELERYAACADLVQADAERAIETASAWRVEGGGLHARQCLGLAYVALERWAPAATVYGQAAREAATANDARVADFHVQAGNAWIAAGEPIRAVQELDAALSAPHLSDELRGEVHLDRARALVALGNADGARTDLDEGLRLVPSDPFAWYLSAALARRQGDGPRARADIRRALEMATDNADITLLAGTIAGEAGDMTEAERLYRRVAEGAPQSEAGRAARASLETLREVEVDASRPAPAPEPQPR